MRSLAVILLAALHAAAAGGAAAQSAEPPDPASTRKAEQPVGTPSSPTLVRPGERALTIFTVASSVFDTNINHELDQVQALGGILGTGAQYKNHPTDPWLDVTYQIALHRYSNTDRWNRLSQNVRALVERDLPGRWSWETVGEISLKGTSEDRELSNQYIVSPRLNYRVGEWHRLRTYAAYRLKRYDTDRERDATNYYGGVELVQRSPRGDRWGLGARLERNDARSDRRDYNRWTYHAEYLAPLGTRDRIELELKTRLQRYPARFVEVDDQDMPRRDQRWIPSITWVRAVSPTADLRLGYVFETRASNDPEREFGAHQFGVTIVRRWW